MKQQINGAWVHIATGGKDFDPQRPAVVFLHGSGMDHRAFALQTRWFAFNGFSVLAPDFPGHSLSTGTALGTIEESATWLAALLDRLGVGAVHMVGHSQGFLSALAFGVHDSGRLKSLTGIGTADAIPVNPALIDTAKKNPTKAAEMMLQWGFGQQVQMGLSPTPGMQPIAIGRQIMRANPLAIDLEACAGYSDGANAASQLNCPSQMILAGQDKMTPIKAGKATAERLGAQTVVLREFGHMLPIEAPQAVLNSLKKFIVAIERA